MGWKVINSVPYLEPKMAIAILAISPIPTETFQKMEIGIYLSLPKIGRNMQTLPETRKLIFLEFFFKKVDYFQVLVLELGLKK